MTYQKCQRSHAERDMLLLPSAERVGGERRKEENNNERELFLLRIYSYRTRR